MPFPTDRFDLFATRVWVFRLASLEAHFAAWIEAIGQWRANDATQGSSNRNGWTSAKTVFDRAGFEPLAEAVRQCFKAAYAEVDLVGSKDFTMSAWVNLQEPGGFNHSHTHGRAALAGSFYLKTPEGSGDLVLRDPRAGVALVGMKGNGVNCFSVTTHTPQAGEFVVFPGWLEHAVDVNASGETRISIPVNSYLAGEG